MNDEEFRGLQERVALIRQMAEMPGWEMAVDRAIVGIEYRQNQLLGGSATSFEQYKELVAWINGVNFFMSIPKAVEKELEVELQNREEI